MDWLIQEVVKGVIYVIGTIVVTLIIQRKVDVLGVVRRLWDGWIRNPWLDWKAGRARKKREARIEKCSNSDGGHDLYVKPFQDHDKGTTIRCFKACGYEELCTHRDKDGLLAEMPLMYSGYVFTYSYKHQTSFPSLGVCRQCMKILGNWGVCILCGEKRTLVTLGVESREWRQKYFELVQEKIRAWWLPLCADDIGCEKRTAKDEFVRVRERVGKWVREQEE